MNTPIKTKKPAKAKKAEAPALVAYKGFNKDLTCLGFQYELGKTYDNGGKPVVRCGAGAFHWVDNPMDAFSYYPPATSRYTMVNPAGEIARDPGGDTKGASSILTVTVDISIGDMVRNAVAWIAEKAKVRTTGDGAHSATTGYGAHSATTGDRAHSATTGDRAHSATTGYGAHSATTGYGAHSATTGDRAHSATTGDRAHSATTGDRAHSATTGYGAHSATTGYGAHSATTG
ncbi:MAG: hypothetical protein AB7F30_03290, partial [Flavobacteriaceae bacterium]